MLAVALSARSPPDQVVLIRDDRETNTGHKTENTICHDTVWITLTRLGHNLGTGAYVYKISTAVLTDKNM